MKNANGNVSHPMANAESPTEMNSTRKCALWKPTPNNFEPKRDAGTTTVVKLQKKIWSNLLLIKGYGFTTNILMPKT